MPRLRVILFAVASIAVGLLGSSRPNSYPAQDQPAQFSFLSARASLRWGLASEVEDETAFQWLREMPQLESREFALGYPNELYRRLLARGAGEEEWWPVSWPSDLAGLVEIRRPGQALEFVRLFSSVDTWHTFPHFGFIEVAAVDELSLRRSGPAKMLRQRFQELGLPETTVKRVGNSVRIRRTVLRMEGRQIWGMAVLDERVARDGHYILRVLWQERIVGLEQSVQSLLPRE